MKKSIDTQFVEKILEFSGTPRLITVCTREIQRSLNYIFTFCFFEINFNIIFNVVCTVHHVSMCR